MLRQQSNLLDIHTVSLMAVTFGEAHLANVFFPHMAAATASISSIPPYKRLVQRRSTSVIV